jgi:hypothetical protein
MDFNRYRSNLRDQSTNPHNRGKTKAIQRIVSRYRLACYRWRECFLCPLIPPKRFQQRQHVGQRKVSGRPDKDTVRFEAEVSRFVVAVTEEVRRPEWPV